MRVRPGIGLVLSLCNLTGLGQGSVRREDRQTAADGVTTGWVLSYDSPDPDRAWERLPSALVVARRGKVIRRWNTFIIRKWAFWDGGREVAYNAGPMHGPSGCFLMSVKTGKEVASYAAREGDCGQAGEDAPEWVKAVRW